jgi:hypothetical protein
VDCSYEEVKGLQQRTSPCSNTWHAHRASTVSTVTSDARTGLGRPRVDFCLATSGAAVTPAQQALLRVWLIHVYDRVTPAAITQFWMTSPHAAPPCRTPRTLLTTLQWSKKVVANVT